jgi:hypothetical protein
MITQNNMCANVIHQISWDGWGVLVARGRELLADADRAAATINGDPPTKGRPP